MLTHTRTHTHTLSPPNFFLSLYLSHTLSLSPSPLSLSLSLSLSSLQAALSETDSRSHKLEERNALLEGQVSDLQERLQLQSGADEQIMNMVTSKASQWEVRPVFAPADMNWASRRMYNTHKRAILYILYGLILGVRGLLNTSWGKHWVRQR